MRILYEYDRGSRCHGLRKVFEEAGHEFGIWGTPAEPAFDIFDKVEPHLFIQSRPATRAVVKCIAERKHLRVVEDFDPEGAADTFLCGKAALIWYNSQNSNLVCDFSYIGDHDTKKEPFILPLAEWGNLKIFGSGPWPTPCSLGRVTDATSCLIHASSKVCLHITTNGRVSDDHLYNALLMGGICVINKLPSNSILSGVVARGESPEQFHHFCVSMLSEDMDMNRKLGIQYVLKYHTYWQRANTLLLKAGFTSEASKLMEVFNDTFAL